MAAFSVEAVVRGYHVYKGIWTAVVGEEFPCRREDGSFTLATYFGNVLPFPRLH